MTCRYCVDGWVVVSLRGEFEEWGPCPKCPDGKLLEFPAPDSHGRTRIGPWGVGGFWEGRPADLEPLHTDQKPLPHSENAARMRTLMASLNFKGMAA
jgi:hypothetical protein